jgi:hypothetical protein
MIGWHCTDFCILRTLEGCGSSALLTASDVHIKESVSHCRTEARLWF